MQAAEQPVGPAKGPLRAHPKNPRYFTDGSGQAIYLTGSHTWNTLQDWGTNDTIQPPDFPAFVQMLIKPQFHVALDNGASDIPRLTYHGEFTAGFQRQSTSLAADGSGQRLGRETEI